MSKAVVRRIASIVYCDTKYNLVDMGTKSLNGAINYFLLQNQQFPPVSKRGKYKTNLKVKFISIIA
eukprot:3621540-Ditylum_brightwellii.AAC.1